MQLRVFARRPNDESHAEVEVKDDASVAALQKAIIVNLKLDMSPNCVRLLREVEGGVPVLLDSRKKLADQGVFEGSTVVVEVTTPQVTMRCLVCSLSPWLPFPSYSSNPTHTHTHTTALEIRLRMPKGREATEIIQHFTSEGGGGRDRGGGEGGGIGEAGRDGERGMGRNRGGG